MDRTRTVMDSHHKNSFYVWDPIEKQLIVGNHPNLQAIQTQRMYTQAWLFTVLSFLFEGYFTVVWYVNATWTDGSQAWQGPVFTVMFCLTGLNLSILVGGDEYKRKMYQVKALWVTMAWIYFICAASALIFVFYNVLASASNTYEAVSGFGQGVFYGLMAIAKTTQMAFLIFYLNELAIDNEWK